jgi:hypothetical protein
MSLAAALLTLTHGIENLVDLRVLLACVVMAERQGHTRSHGSDGSHEGKELPRMALLPRMAVDATVELIAEVIPDAPLRTIYRSRNRLIEHGLLIKRRDGLYEISAAVVSLVAVPTDSISPPLLSVVGEEEGTATDGSGLRSKVDEFIREAVQTLSGDPRATPTQREMRVLRQRVTELLNDNHDLAALRRIVATAKMISEVEPHFVNHRNVLYVLSVKGAMKYRFMDPRSLKPKTAPAPQPVMVKPIEPAKVIELPKPTPPPLPVNPKPSPEELERRERARHEADEADRLRREEQDRQRREAEAKKKTEDEKHRERNRMLDEFYDRFVKGEDVTAALKAAGIGETSWKVAVNLRKGRKQKGAA